MRQYRQFVRAAAFVLLAGAGTGLAQKVERIDMDPEMPSYLPGSWVEQDTGEARPVFEEDTTPVVVWDTGFCLLRIESDTVPTRVYIDGRQFVQVDPVMLVQVPPGRHHVGYFPLYRVQLAFRREIPSPYWRAVGERARLAGDYDLISAHDASAVREGTRWVVPARGDTAQVSLSWKDARRAYARTGGRTAVALFGITTAIAIAMVISEALVDN